MSNNIKLIKPNTEYKEAFLEAISEYEKNGEMKYAAFYQSAKDNFEDYILKRANYEKGLDLEPGWVPASTFWLINEEDKIAGIIRIRHSLNDKLRKIGGHIGYDIPPSHRKKGYGTQLLKFALKEAKNIGLDRVLITCDTDNIGSIKIIEKNGGVLEGEYFDQESNRYYYKYWIYIRDV